MIKLQLPAILLIVGSGLFTRCLDAAEKRSKSLGEQASAESTAPMPGSLVPANTQPHVLFLAIDDLNDWIGAMGGHPQAKTPNLDRLISQSVLFTNAHCAAPVCSASRHALFSGLRPSTTGWYSNSSTSLKAYERVLGETVPMPTHFKRNGYRDGSEELYDHRTDPNEHRNLASDPKWANIKNKLRDHLPNDNVAPRSIKEGGTDSYGRRYEMLRDHGVPDWLGAGPTAQETNP